MCQRAGAVSNCVIVVAVRLGFWFWQRDAAELSGGVFCVTVYHRSLLSLLLVLGPMEEWFLINCNSEL